MIHALIALALAALAWTVGLHTDASAMSSAFYCGRAWDVKSVVDWLGPVSVAALAMAV